MAGTTRDERLRWRPEQAMERLRASGDSGSAALALCDQLGAAGVPLAALEMAIVVWSRALDGLDPGPVPADRLARLDKDLSLETTPVVSAWMKALRAQTRSAHDLDLVIRFLMQARGIWLALGRIKEQTAAPDDEFPVGATVDGGRCLVIEAIRGDDARGMFRAVDPLGQRLLVTVTSSQKQPLAQLEEELGWQVAGLARLRHVGPIGDQGHHALVEEEPDGRPSSEWAMPLPPAQAVGLAAEVAAVLERAHAAGLVLGFLRPELIYLDDPDGTPGVSGIAPRADVFAMGATAVYGAKPLFDHFFAAPEVLAMRKEVTPAADVFSLCAVLAMWLTGEHPFVGDTPTEQLGAIVGGRGRLWRGPTELGMVVGRGLERDPGARPSLAGLVRDLRRAAAEQ